MNLISVLMPVYNVERYIDEAVTSILNQTYTELELVIVDDCSTDATYTHLQKLAQTDDRIKLLRNDVNLKICKTLNKAYAISTGQYIARMDGDDISLPCRLEILKEYLDTHPTISLVGSQLISIDEYGKILSCKRYPCSSSAITKGNQHISSVPHFWLARREIYERLTGYREIPYAEDYDFLLRGEILGYRYGNSDQFLYKCRLRAGNTVSANGLKQRKTVAFVKKLHKVDIANNFVFSATNYQESLNYTQREQKKFLEASQYLNAAVTSTSIVKKAKWSIAAAISSPYIREYLLEALYFRILILTEKERYSQKRILK